MKIGLVSDVHGNAAALAQALALMSDSDEIVCLGDSINQYRFSNDVVRLLKARAAHVIVGNHEEAFYGAGGARARERDWIERDLMDWLGAQPARKRLEIGGKRLLLVHSTPWASGGAYVVPEHPLFARFGEADADLVLYGHTHLPVSARVKGVHVVNPGSAGEARVGGEAPKMSCAVLDIVSEDVRHIAFTA